MRYYFYKAKITFDVIGNSQVVTGVYGHDGVLSTLECCLNKHIQLGRPPCIVAFSSINFLGECVE